MFHSLNAHRSACCCCCCCCSYNDVTAAFACTTHGARCSWWPMHSRAWTWHSDSWVIARTVCSRMLKSRCGKSRANSTWLQSPGTLYVVWDFNSSSVWAASDSWLRELMSTRVVNCCDLCFACYLHALTCDVRGRLHMPLNWKKLKRYRMRFSFSFM